MRNRCISTIKGIACILIVFIHCRFPGSVGAIVTALARPAVFFFFMVSGFFVYSDDFSKFANKVRRQSGKVFRMTVVCLAIAFLWRILYALIGDDWSVSSVIHSIFNLQSLVKMLVFQADIVLGPFWFLLALFVCYIAVYILRRINLIGICPILIIITLAVNVFLSEFNQNVDDYYYRNFWLTGFPFYMTGYLIHQDWDRIRDKMSNGILIAGMVLGVIMTVVESLFFGNSLIYVGCIITVLSCFLYSVQNPICSIPVFESVGERLSMYVYCSHWFVMEALGTIVRRIGLAENMVFLYFYPIITVICTLILSSMIYKLANQRKTSL